ncbi:hypothetical protein [Salibacterium lacus]|uniref:Uncharacterized protein n=1 Tax=Salibacterium lacus TaxID=1898109 RepID=A0ABW5SY17_9BACI
MQIENPMVLRNPVLDPDEPDLIGKCEDCGCDIVAHEEALLFENDVLLHEDFACLANYMRKHAVKVGESKC